MRGVSTAAVDTTWSFLLRHSGEILDLVERQDVRLQRRDGEDLLLVTVEREEGIREGLDVAARVLQVAAQDPEIRRELAGSVVSGLEWSRFLPREDRESLVDEFADTVRACVELGHFQPLGQLIREWKATAAVHADPSLVEALRAPAEPGAGEVSRPAA